MRGEYIFLEKKNKKRVEKGECVVYNGVKW